MKRNFKKIIGFAFIWVWIPLFLYYQPTQAQEGEFIEHFENGNLERWEYSDGVIIRDGVMRISPGNFAVKFGNFGDGTIGVKIKHAGSGAVFIRYHMGEGGSYTLVILDDIIILEKSFQDRPKELGSHEWGGGLGDWVGIRIVVQDGTHEIYLDDDIIIQAMDIEPFPGGEIGLMVEGEGIAEFDDMYYEPISGASEEVEGVLPINADIQENQEPPPKESPDRLTISDFLAELSNNQAAPTDISTFIINLGLSIILAFILSRVYVHWGSSLSNRRRFASNFILLTVTTTFIILIVRSSVALSLGLVGALSIVRFRAAIKEPEELAYLFFAIGIGIGLGDNQRVITVLAMVAAILVLGVMRLFRGQQVDFNLHVGVISSNPNKIELETIIEALKPHTSQLKLMRFDDSGSAVETSFLVEFRNMESLKSAKAALRELSDSLTITFMDNKGVL